MRILLPLCANGSRTTLINPATEESFAEVAAAQVEDVNLALESAQRAWESGWRDITPGKRTEILFNVASRLREKGVYLITGGLGALGREDGTEVDRVAQ